MIYIGYLKYMTNSGWQCNTASQTSQFSQEPLPSSSTFIHLFNIILVSIFLSSILLYTFILPSILLHCILFAIFFSSSYPCSSFLSLAQPILDHIIEQEYDSYVDATCNPLQCRYISWLLDNSFYSNFIALPEPPCSTAS